MANERVFFSHMSCQPLRKYPELNRKLSNYLSFPTNNRRNMLETIQKWLDTVELNEETSVHAKICLKLAESFDNDGHTSTAEALRRSVNDLKKLLASQTVEVDPLAELLTR
jgi:hypothetical protein